MSLPASSLHGDSRGNKHKGVTATSTGVVMPRTDAYDHTAKYLNRAGVNAEFIPLLKDGVAPIEQNNLDIVHVVDEWVSRARESTCPRKEPTRSCG
jgi:hypothetical protein